MWGGLALPTLWLLTLLKSPSLEAVFARQGLGSGLGDGDGDNGDMGHAAVRKDTSSVLQDISNAVCWVGDWTKERCCQGDANTVKDCWSDTYTFGECCPNSDCWDSGFTYEQCCDTQKFGEQGNSVCWSGSYTYEHCCLANATALNWIDVFTSAVETEQFYAMDEFYIDAQYGKDFGYYSTGRVLRSDNGAVQSEVAQQFAHFTTYPMALSPQFGGVFCRNLFLMWIHLNERAPFRVVEMGAGSGQLAVDIQQCVRTNELGIAPPVWRRWVAAFEYLIIERSPALAQHQRQRGLRVIAGDATDPATCQAALAALTDTPACANGAGVGSPECVAGVQGTADTGASVIVSNELLDAFAPLKLRLNVQGELNVTDCRVWKEIRMLHFIPEKELKGIMDALEHNHDRIEALLTDLRAYTHETFCGIVNSTIGQAAREAAPEGSCLALVLALSELLHHVDLRLPSAAHNMRLRLRRDEDLGNRLRGEMAKLEAQFENVVVVPREVYQQLRHELRKAPQIEAFFLSTTQTRQVPVPLSEQRCANLRPWMKLHELRVERLAALYESLGYLSIQFLVRLGEERFVELVDCLIGQSGGYALTVDYGASFEALGHSMSIDMSNDGIFIPPVPMELLQDLPDCYGSWPTCAGRVDWTTFVDFTNIAAAGEQRGWRTLFYGPQSLLEQNSRQNVTINGKFYSVPGYSVLAKSWASHHVKNWYGREILSSSSDTAGWQQRWTSFKTLLLEKPAQPSAPRPNIVVFPTWHLDADEADSCWHMDPTALPLADWIRRQQQDDPRQALGRLTEATSDKLGREYAEAYEEAQLAVRLVDWLVATEGCENFRPHRAQSLLNSQGLWKSLQRRMLHVWEDIWGSEAVVRVARAILQRLAGEEEAGLPGAPYECIGQQVYAALCMTAPESQISLVAQE